jgi:hypothetical protein
MKRSGLKRGTPLARKAALRRGTARLRARPDYELLAVPKPPIHAKDAAFIAWLHSRPCIACGEQFPGGFDQIEAAHLDSVRYGDVENAVSLCGSRHHREGKESLHQLGRSKFEYVWNLDLRAHAKQLYATYLRDRGGDAN